MAGTRQILFIQGGGAGTHDEWDDKLVESLSRELGDGHEIRYPRMPDEDDPSLDTWGPVIRTGAGGRWTTVPSWWATRWARPSSSRPSPTGRRSVCSGRSCSSRPPSSAVRAGTATSSSYPMDLGARLPPGVPVHLFHGLQDETAPPSHVDLYARAIPHATVHRLPGRDHQLNDDLSEVAEAIGAGGS